MKLEIIEFPGCSYSLLSLRLTVPSDAPGDTRFYRRATREPSGNHQSQEVMQSHADVFRPNLGQELTEKLLLRFTFLLPALLPPGDLILFCAAADRRLQRHPAQSGAATLTPEEQQPAVSITVGGINKAWCGACVASHMMQTSPERSSS